MKAREDLSEKVPIKLRYEGSKRGSHEDISSKWQVQRSWGRSVSKGPRNQQGSLSRVSDWGSLGAEVKG